MTTLAFPTGIVPQTTMFKSVANTKLHTSPLNGYIQALYLPGTRWAATYTFPPMDGENAAILKAFLMSLEGSAGRFYGKDFSYAGARGVATGTPLVNGASQTGGTLITDGWTAGQTGILKKGDYFTVNNELKMMTADVNSDGSGNATLQFKPNLRSSPNDNASIEVSAPTCVMMLTDNDQTQWEAEPPYIHSITINAVEALS